MTPASNVAARIDHARAFEQFYKLARDARPASAAGAGTTGAAAAGSAHDDTPLPALEVRKSVKHNLTTLRKFLVQHPRAEEPLAQSLKTLREHFPATSWRLAIAESEYGACLVALGRAREGEDLLRRGYQNLRAALGEKHRRTRQAFDLLNRAAATPPR